MIPDEAEAGGPGESINGILVPHWNKSFGEGGLHELFISPSAGLVRANDSCNLDVIVGSDEWFPDPGTTEDYERFFGEQWPEGVWHSMMADDGSYRWLKDTESSRAATSVAVVDLDGDGPEEMVGASTGGTLEVLKAATGEFVWTFPSPPVSSYGDFPWGRSSPAVADTDPSIDGLEVIAFHSMTTMVYAFQGLQNGVNEKIRVVDYIDTDLSYWRDLYYSGELGIEGRDWDLLWFANLTTVGGIPETRINDYSTPAIADVDADGDLDVVIGSLNGYVYVIDGQSGTILSSFPTGPVMASAAVTNVNDDAESEIYVGNIPYMGQNPTFYALRWNSTTTPPGLEVMWARLDAIGEYISSPAIGDIDADGGLEVVVGFWDQVRSRDALTGELEWSFQTEHEAVVDSSPALAVRSNVSRWEMTWPFFRANVRRTGYLPSSGEEMGVYVGTGAGFGASEGSVYLLNGSDGSVIDRFFVNYLSDDVKSSPVLGDIDGDYKLEVNVLSSYFGMGPTLVPPDSYPHFWSIKDNGSSGSGTTACGGPVADFGWWPLKPEEGHNISFIDLSYDTDGYIVAWDWNFAGEGASAQQNPTHSFGHAGLYGVTLTVEDNDGYTASVTKYVNVTNVAPTVQMTVQPATVPEGSESTFDGYFDDPSWNDTHTATWYFGDGESAPGGFSPGRGDTHHEMNATTHAYGRCGCYTSRLVVEDDLVATGEDSKVVNVTNVNPSVTLLPPIPVNPPEGSPATFNGFFDDPSWLDNHTAQWDFGDGTIVPGSFTPGYGHTHHEMNAMQHTYGHGGPYTVTLTVWDDCNGSGQASLIISVNNVPPSVSMWAIPPTANEGQEVTFDGYFDDPSWNDTHTAVWDFGDSFKPQGSFSPGQGSTHHEMNAVTHSFGRKGTYMVCLNVTDDMNGVGSACVAVTVNNVAPTVTALINTTVIPEGSPFRVNGFFHDPSWNDTFPEVAWDFLYRDDMTGLGPKYYDSYLPPPGYRNTDHVVPGLEWIYGDDGDYTIYLNVTDEFGGSGSDNDYVVIENVPPTVMNITSILHRNAPRTHGYWKHQCTITTPRPDHPGIRQEWIDAIREQSTVFTNVYTKADVCNYLNPPKPQTPMKKAKMQMMALWLNVVSDLLWMDSPLHHPMAPSDHSVREFIQHAENLILYSPTDPNLLWVNNIATDINESAKGAASDWGPIDPLVGEYVANAMDQGTDDLTFIWEDSYYLTKTIHHKYNNGVTAEPDYDPLINRIRTPGGTYPFVTLDRLVIGYPKQAGTGVTASLLCVRDDDGGESPQAHLDCNEGPSGGKSGSRPGMILGDDPTPSVDWNFSFTVSYRTIEGGFVIAEVTAICNWHDPLVAVTIVGGYIENNY